MTSHRELLKICRIITLAVALQFLASGVASAAPAGFNEAVQSFNGKQYAKALSGFEAISRSNPSDTLTHYYMGLCYHYLNQVTPAAQQYQWVASNGSDSRLRAQALNALQQLGRYQATRTHAGSTVVASFSSPGSNASPSRLAGGQLKVLEFYTDWCGPCKRFRPEFEQLQSDFGSKVAFQSLNAEDGGTGSDLAERYKVTAYPTVIYLNGSQVVDRHSGASYQTCASRINKLLGN